MLPDCLRRYRRYNPESYIAKTLRLRALSLSLSLSRCRIEHISDTVDAILPDEEELPFESLVLNIIFARSFFPALLCEIRKCKRCVLLGNLGIGKSFFQFYYLTWLVNRTSQNERNEMREDLFGPLPPDCFSSTEPQKLSSDKLECQGWQYIFSNLDLRI